MAMFLNYCLVIPDRIIFSHRVKGKDFSLPELNSPGLWLPQDPPGLLNVGSGLITPVTLAHGLEISLI